MILCTILVALWLGLPRMPLSRGQKGILLIVSAVVIIVPVLWYVLLMVGFGEDGPLLVIAGAAVIALVCVFFWKLRLKLAGE